MSAGRSDVEKPTNEKQEGNPAGVVTWQDKPRCGESFRSSNQDILRILKEKKKSQKRFLKRSEISGKFNPHRYVT